MTARRELHESAFAAAIALAWVLFACAEPVPLSERVLRTIAPQAAAAPRRGP